MGLPISTNCKSENYNSILVIINWLTKIVYYKAINITINALRLAQVILNVVIWHHGLFNLIVSNKSLLFNFKILVIILLLLQNQTNAFHSFLSLDGWPNQISKQNNKSLLLSFCQSWTEWLGKILANDQICLYQC